MFQKTCLFLLGCLFAANLSASSTVNDPLILRTTAEAEGIQVLLANLEGVTTTINFTSLDSKEVLLDKQVRKHNGFSYDLKLDELPNGRYLLKVKKGDVLRQQVILISEAGIFLSQIK